MPPDSADENVSTPTRRPHFAEDWSQSLVGRPWSQAAAVIGAILLLHFVDGPLWAKGAIGGCTAVGLSTLLALRHGKAGDGA